MATFTRTMFERDDAGTGVDFREFAHALTVWVLMQGRANVTVAEAALAWNTAPEVIREAVDEAYWLCLGQRDTLDLEGA